MALPKWMKGSFYEGRWETAVERGGIFSARVIGLNELLEALQRVGVYSASASNWGGIYAGLIKEYLEGATKTWGHDPAFRIEGLHAGSSGRARVSVITSDKPFIYVNEGTRAHWIRPKTPGGVLAFNSVFRPKSTPGSLRASRGFSGPPVAFAQAVWHPGTEARHFDRLAAQQAQRVGSAKVLNEIQTRWASALSGGSTMSDLKQSMPKSWGDW